MTTFAYAQEDRLPDDKAVWREGVCASPAHAAICVEYAGGIIARTYAGSVLDWGSVVRWRFGWPPK